MYCCQSFTYCRRASDPPFTSPVSALITLLRPGMVLISRCTTSSHFCCWPSIFSLLQPMASRPFFAVSLSLPMARKFNAMASKNFFPASVSANPGNPPTSCPSSAFQASAFPSSSVLALSASPFSQFLVVASSVPASAERDPALALSVAINWEKASPCVMLSDVPARASESPEISPMASPMPVLSLMAVSSSLQVPGALASSTLAPFAMASMTLPGSVVLNVPSVSISAVASVAVILISASFLLVSSSIRAKSSSTVVCAGLFKMLNSSFRPDTVLETTGSKRDPTFVWSWFKLFCSNRSPFANPSDVRAKSPCTSAVACIRY